MAQLGAEITGQQIRHLDPEWLARECAPGLHQFCRQLWSRKLALLAVEPNHLGVSSRDLAINQLLQLARLDYPISGNLSVDLSMHGSQLNPMGKGSVRLDESQRVWTVVAAISDSVRRKRRCAYLVARHKFASRLWESESRSLIRNAKVTKFNSTCLASTLAQLKAVQDKNLGLAGVLTVNANGHGTVDDPQLALTVQIPQLKVRDATISGIKANINVANRQAHLDLDSEILQTSVQARATVNISDGHYTRATLDTKGLPIEGLLALRGPAKSNGPRGIVEVHATAEGPLDDKNRMQGEVIIPTLKAEYQGLQIGNAQPIHIHYANSTVALDPAEISGTDTTLRLQGQLPLQGTAPSDAVRCGYGGYAARAFLPE